MFGTLHQDGETPERIRLVEISSGMMETQQRDEAGLRIPVLFEIAKMSTQVEAARDMRNSS